MSPRSRIREAIRSGWNRSKSSSFSPAEANITGLPVTWAIDSAAPPRASPSSLVSTTPSKPTPSRKACAVVTASWPIIESTTNRISSGSTASLIAAAWLISSASMPSRPAVSMITMLCSLCLASPIESRATRTGSPTPLPGCGAYTGTPAWPPSTSSCCTALGRCRSAATSNGVLPWLRSQSASFAASVVLPEPCRPASMITVGATLANLSRLASPPRIPTSSSLTILMTCCAGLSAWATSAPSERSFTRAMKSRTTGSATSASSSAILISRQVASMSAGESRPRPRRAEKTCVSRSESVSNTCGELLRAGYPLCCLLSLVAEQRVDERRWLEWGEIVRALAEADQLDRHPKLTLNRHHDAALGRPVQFGQDDPGHVNRLGEDSGLAQPVLAGSRVKHEQHFVDGGVLFDHPLDLA